METEILSGGGVETLIADNVKAAVLAALNDLKSDAAETGKVKLIGSRSSTAGVGTWTISGCTPYLPVHIIMQETEFRWSIAMISVVSGTIHNDDSRWNTYGTGAYAIGRVEGWAASNVLVFIPTSSVFVIRINHTSGTYTLRAFT